MRPTDILKNEHEAITVMLGILEKICTKLQAGSPVDPKHLDQILEFITTFTDQCHHGKEENLLFPAMVAAGIPKEGGPIGVMLSEHEEGRYYVQEVSRALDRYRRDPNAATSVMEPLRLYISHLAQHIHKENRILFPMADHYLSEDQQTELLIEFDEMEEQVIGKGKHEEFHAMLDQLSKVYLK